jgi:hypothetical protein
MTWGLMKRGRMAVQLYDGQAMRQDSAWLQANYGDVRVTARDGAPYSQAVLVENTGGSSSLTVTCLDMEDKPSSGRVIRSGWPGGGRHECGGRDRVRQGWRGLRSHEWRRVAPHQVRSSQSQRLRVQVGHEPPFPTPTNSTRASTTHRPRAQHRRRTIRTGAPSAGDRMKRQDHQPLAGLVVSG